MKEKALKLKQEWIRRIEMAVYYVQELLRKIYVRMYSSLSNTEGIGVVEVILILVVLIGLVLIFKSQLTELVEDIFETITNESSNV